MHKLYDIKYTELNKNYLHADLLSELVEGSVYSVGVYTLAEQWMHMVPTNSSSPSSSVGPVANATDVLQPSRLIVLTLYPPRPVWTFLRSLPGTPCPQQCKTS